MPAPKTPNTDAAAEARRRQGDETAIARLVARGYTVTPPTSEPTRSSIPTPPQHTPFCTDRTAHDRHAVYQGKTYLGMCEGVLPEPYVGMPATINLYTDRTPAVVVKVNAKSIVVRSVEYDESNPTRINNEGEPFPVLSYPGDVTKPVGTPERYSRIDTPTGPRYRNGSISLTLGQAVRLVDYRH